MIVAGVSAAGVERIDLLRGAGPFVLTPFLVLSPFIVLAALVHWATYGVDDKAKLTRFGGWLVFLLCFVLLVSLFFSETSRSVSRYFLLVALITGGWALITLVRRTGDYSALRVGAALGLALYVGFDVIQWGLFQSHGLNGPSFGGVMNLKISSYGDGVVRLAGGSLDPNRAAVTVATYTYILIGDPLISRYKSVVFSSAVLILGAGLALATISRSGLLVFFCVMVGAIAAIWRRQSNVQKLGLLGILSTIIVWVSQTRLIDSLNVEAIAESRLSLRSEGSANTHFSLFSMGWEVISANPISFFTGNGYGSSFLYLQDVFPGNEYANYHSMYVTLLVEAGIVGLLLMVIMLVRPVLSGRRWLAIGVIFFGVFYQGMSDPVFWLQMAMFWALPLGPGSHGLVEAEVTRLGSLVPPLAPTGGSGVRSATP